MLVFSCRSSFHFIFFKGFIAHKDYFNHFELSQSLGGAKTQTHREKPPGSKHKQAEVGLSHIGPK